MPNFEEEKMLNFIFQEPEKLCPESEKGNGLEKVEFVSNFPWTEISFVYFRRKRRREST